MDMFIADTHFGHENILKECRPQFSSIEEMNSVIIDNINQRMKRSDTLYIVGDFSFRSKASPIEYLERIKPKKILIVGNHDRDWLKKLSEDEKARYFLGVYDQHTVKKQGIELHLNHYPRLAWNRSHFFAQSFSIVGHIHNMRESTVAARLFPEVRCQFNAGVEVNGFRPVTFEELVANNNAFYRFEYTDDEREALESATRKIMS